MNELRFCLFCKRQPPEYPREAKGWEHIGGTIGESHYVCPKKSCRKRHAENKRRMRAHRDANRKD